MTFNIRNPKNLRLPSYAVEIMNGLFSDYEETILLNIYTAGLSSSLVYLTRPIRQDAGHLANVVKIDVTEQILKEVEAYNNHVDGILPNSVRIIGEPSLSIDEIWSGIRIELAGSGYYEIQSLLEYLNFAEPSKIFSVLNNQIFHSMGAFWKYHGATPEFRPAYGYDDILPPNLILEFAKSESNSGVIFISPENIPSATPAPGSHVTLKGFEVQKRDPNRNRLTLNLPGHSYHTSFEIKIESPDILKFKVGDLFDVPQVLAVKESRVSLFTKLVGRIFGGNFTADQKTIIHPNGAEFPNPLFGLPTLLEQTFDVYLSKVHGDFNLQNVLVNKETGNFFVIDFAHTQINHSLRDLLHLEMCVVNQLLAEELSSQMVSAPYIVLIYDALHELFTQNKPLNLPSNLNRSLMWLQTIRETVQQYLFNKSSWKEYYTCLAIYLLSSLRFDNLDDHPAAPLPKQLAFWGAAAAMNLIEKEGEDSDGKKAPYRRPFASPLNSGDMNVSKLVKETTSLNILDKQNALTKILSIAASKSAQLLMYGSCLGAIAIAPEHTMTATLMGLASGIGVNSLASLIERVALQQDTSEAEVTSRLEFAIEKSEFEKVITENKVVLSEIRNLVVWQEQIYQFIKTDNTHMVDILMSFDTSVSALQSEFEAMRADIRRLQKLLSSKTTKKAEQVDNQISIQVGDIESSERVVVTGEETTGNPGLPKTKSATEIKAGNIKARDVVITGKKQQ